MSTKTVKEALAEYEAAHEFVRRVTLPVEDRAKYMPQVKWQGGYRWFRSRNIVCLEKYKRLKTAGRL